MTLNHVQIFLEHIFDCLKLIEVDSSYFLEHIFDCLKVAKICIIFYMCMFEGGKNVHYFLCAFLKVAALTEEEMRRRVEVNSPHDAYFIYEWTI